MGLWKEDVFEKGLCIPGQQLGFGNLDQEIKPIRRHVSSYGRDQRWMQYTLSGRGTIGCVLRATPPTGRRGASP